MILVESSVCCDFFSSSPGPAGAELHRRIAEAEAFAVTGVIVAEVFRSQWEMLEPRGFSTYHEAAATFRLARGKGITLTTIDTLIAAIALEHGAPVFALDKDFARLARLTRLPLYPFPD